MTSITNKSAINLFSINACLFPKSNNRYFIQVNLNTIPSYYTNKECGVSLVVKKRRWFDMGGSASKNANFKLSIFYIDVNHYKQELVSTTFTPIQLEENLLHLDAYDSTTRFGLKERSTAMEKINRFFNDDGIGTEYIRKYGVETIFSLEVVRLP
jgi:hypothetical protein